MNAWFGRFGPALVAMTAIFLASATPASELPKFGIWDLLVKKGGHMLGYGLLAAAYWHALKKSPNAVRFTFLIAFCLTVLYAATDEWHQHFVSGRTPSFRDVCIDAAGGLISLAFLRQLKNPRTNSSGTKH